jgi:plastocyanin
MRKGSTLVLVAIAALSWGAFGGASSAAGATAVTVGNNFFAPTKKTVERGTKVNFKWIGGERHHVVKSKGPGGEIKSPATAKPGVHLAKRFEKAGIYRFICTFHPTEMRLKLTVR